MKIARTLSTPEIVLDTGESHLYIIGSSYPETAIEFYKPIYDAVVEYVDKLSEGNSFCMSLAMEYLNTGSVHELNRIFRYLSESNNKVFVLWCWEEEDEDMLEEGEVFSSIYPMLNFSYKMVFDPKDISFL